MKKLVILLAAALLVLPAVVTAQELDRVTRSDDGNRYGRPDIEVWTDNNDGVYYEGENVSVYFRADRDCYMAVYSIDTRGNVNLLFPANRMDDGYVRGGEVYAIPGNNADYDLVVNGPEGMEVIQAIASPGEFEIPDWYNGAPVHCGYRDDRDEFRDYINHRYFGCRWDDCDQSFAQTTMYVKVPRYYYRPVYTPHDWHSYPDYSVVYIDYPYGGEIYIDGIFFGIAPLWIPRVVYGHHWFTIYDRYGYCWEDQIIVDHHSTIRLDHSRVKTNRTVVSRYVDKDIRVQAKKFDRTSFVKSEERVKSVRSEGYNNTAKKYFGSDDASGRASKRTVNGKEATRSGDRVGSRKSGGESDGSTSGWNTPRPSTKKGDRSGSYDKPESSKRSEPTKGTTRTIDRPSGSSQKGSGTSPQSGSYKNSGSSTGKGSQGSSTPSKGSSSKSSSGSSKKGSSGGDKSGPKK